MRIMNRRGQRVAAAGLLAVLVIAACPRVAGAQGSPAANPDLALATLEELMKVRITSASRHEQRADEVPAAVFVLTQADIRRSGMRTLPELFRLIPGVQVAQVNSSTWAVSIRGFNDLFSNKLLVLIDGRSIYARVFSGVFWDAEDLVLDDIDRIEVIRGPGAAVWGANAVNGVINIVTKSAHDSQGLLLRAGAGTFDRATGTVRYGGRVGDAAYRLYSQWTARGETNLAAAQTDDGWNVFTTGGRLDWSSGRSAWLVDGTVRTGEAQTTWQLPASGAPNPAPRTEVASSFRTGHVLGRWTHTADSGSSLQVQSSIALLRRVDFVALDETTLDADLQYHVKGAGRHDVVVGGGYRHVNSTTGRNFSVSFEPAAAANGVASVFLQDEIALADHVRLTLGSKLEHETYSRWGLQPTVRILWTPQPGQHLWGAVSRALRTPSLADLNVRVKAIAVPGDGALMVFGAVGNPQYRSEELASAEAGYRVEIGPAAFVDATAFRGHYRNLPTSEPLPAVLEGTAAAPQLFVATRPENRLRADTAGLEVSAHVSPAKVWRIDGSFSAFRLIAHADVASFDPQAALNDGNAPARQWRLHSSVRAGSRTDLDVTMFRVGRLATLAVPAYTRLDARGEIILTRRLSAIVSGRNLLQGSHVEFASPVVLASRIPRSASIQLVWRY
jgi:iron complex outermembrane receptor protein